MDFINNQLSWGTKHLDSEEHFLFKENTTILMEMDVEYSKSYTREVVLA